MTWRIPHQRIFFMSTPYNSSSGAWEYPPELHLVNLLVSWQISLFALTITQVLHSNLKFTLNRLLIILSNKERTFFFFFSAFFYYLAKEFPKREALASLGQFFWQQPWSWEFSAQPKKMTHIDILEKDFLCKENQLLRRMFNNLHITCERIQNPSPS